MTSSITNAFMDKVAVSSQMKVENKNSADNNFKQALNGASSSNNVAESNYSNKPKKTDYAKKQETNDNDYKAEKNNSQKPEQTDKSTPVKENEKIEEQKTIEEQKNIEETGNKEDISEGVSEEISNEIISQVAAALNIPVSELIQILEEIDIEGIDLTEKANVNQLVQKILGAENSVELLNKAGVKETFDNIEQAIAKAFENMEEGKVEVSENSVKTAEITVSVKTEMVETATTVKPQVIVEEDGENRSLRSQEVSSEEAQVKPANPNPSANNESNQSESNLFGEAETEINMFVQPGSAETQSFNGVSATTQAARNINSADVVNQIVEKIKIDLKADVTEIKLNLRPEHLGDVSLKISSENGIITAQFVAESQRIKEIIEANFNALKDSLAEQGINVSELSVSVSNGEGNQQMQEFLQGRAKSQSRISSIIGAIEEEERVSEEELIQKEIHKNNVNYLV